jgi:hypothetical protein
MVGADIIRKEANPTGRLREAQVNVFLVGDHARGPDSNQALGHLRYRLACSRSGWGIS